MRDYKEEKKDVEDFITGTIKKLTPDNKRKAADICLGMILAQEGTKKNPPASMPQCGQLHSIDN